MLGKGDVFTFPFTERDARDLEVGMYTFAGNSVSTQRALGKVDKAFFSRFCRMVRWTAEHRRAHITMGIDDHPGEVPAPPGPAISCPVASNVDWRVELSYTGARWRVSRLVVGLH
jgi:hypothetical protein